ncbi:MAG TPA: carboxypeptidase regulatory-like domain-containing protein [Patescibacteria group bacterium]|nr:carboxypeptidase regulatory-like domain-containing protein [Patescibacteria group bacterium]
MRVFTRSALWLMVCMVSAVSLAIGATISGTVKGPAGKPFEGAFVEAQNTTTNISTDVLSHADGRYTVPNLPAGTYRLTIRAVGYKAVPQSETLQSADQHAKADFALQKGAVSWTDLSVWQGRTLLPDGPGKDLIFGAKGKSGGLCFACHEFQTRMASRRLNYQGWLGLVNYMRYDAVSYFIGPNGTFPFSNQMAGQVATYLTQVFGVDSTLPASPADLPSYQATVRNFSNEAMNIVYVVYPTPDQTWLPFQMYPPTAKGYPSDGSIWVANFGNANEVDRIDPVTGKAQVYHAPCSHAANIHAIEIGPRGDAWFGESGCNSVGRVDVKTGKVTEYYEKYPPGLEWGSRGGERHDAHAMLVDGKLYVFSSGLPPSRLDPATGKFTQVPGLAHSYDVYEDKLNGNLWFTNIYKGGKLSLVDPKTLKTVMQFAPSVDPEHFAPHRIGISEKGVVWLTCYGNRVCRFDPKTKAFKIYTPLGPNQSDYAIGLDGAGNVWYSMEDLDTLQRIDPKTGQIVEYPFPYSEITMRKFWTDTKGRIWTTSPSNGVVVYWYLAGGDTRAAK